MVSANDSLQPEMDHFWMSSLPKTSRVVFSKSLSVKVSEKPVIFFKEASDSDFGSCNSIINRYV